MYGMKENAYKDVVGKTKAKRPYRRLRHRLEVKRKKCKAIPVRGHGGPQDY
jgi:hypothetical protein